MITIELVGPPLAWTAPKVTRNGHTFSPKYQQKMDHQCLVRNEFTGNIITQPVCIEIYFYMPIPKSTSKKMMDQILSGSVLHTKKPDLDNLLKVLDALNEVVWRDDKQIVEAQVSKAFGPRPCLIIEVLAV